MPRKYQIHTEPVPNRFLPITRSGVVAWEEGCLRCVECVKRKCVYGVYEKRSLDPRQMMDSLDYLCQDCFRCVQSCPARLIHKTLNPQYIALGDECWTPDIIQNLWYQAATGRIPVSGAGYGGPFAGEGFDSIWTDMSEIVRPTRDGIHGREYISTQVELGSKPCFLKFDQKGDLIEQPPPTLEIPLPVIFEMPQWSPSGDRVAQALLHGAGHVGTYALLDRERLQKMPKELRSLGIPILGHGSRPTPEGDRMDAPLVEIHYSHKWRELWGDIKRQRPDLIVAARLLFTGDVANRCAEMVRNSVEVIHLCADPGGRQWGGGPHGRFIKDGIKEVHQRLVEEGIRDQVTLIAGGGIAMAEHMAKAIICGADLVSVDVALLVAMECRVCGRCAKGLDCPVQLESVDPVWGGLRIRNLMAGWHNQLLEVMGAMGMRDVRRLRGEMGRAMFFEELQQEFLSLIGPKSRGHGALSGSDGG